MNRKYGLFFRLFSSFLILAFSCETVSFAAGDLKPFQVSPHGEKVHLSYKIPPSVARIEDSYQAPLGAATVFLLQDAHTNESGQLNLASTLDVLFKNEKDLHTVYTEAAVGDSSLSFLRSAKPLEERRRLARLYIRKGLLHGAEYLDLTSDHAFTIWGVENPKLYIQALEHYRAAVKDRERFELYLKKIRAGYETLSGRLVSPALKGLLDRSGSFESGDLPLTEYFDALSGQAKKFGVVLSGFHSLSLLRDLKTREEKIDFKRANQEEALAVKRLSPEDRRTLSEAAMKAGASTFSGGLEDPQRGYFSLLETKLAGQMADYQELFKYFDYLKAAGNIETSLILSELHSLERSVIDAMAGSEDERTFAGIARMIRLYEKLFHLTLTPADHAEYESMKINLGIEHLTGFLNKKIMDLGTYYERSLFLETGYEDILTSCETFYSLTRSRDLNFVNEMTQRMDRTGEKKAALVTGGFHTANLKALLKERGISYVSLTPQVLRETNLRRYEDILLGQRMPAKTPAVYPAASMIGIGHAPSSGRIPVPPAAITAIESFGFRSEQPAGAPARPAGGRLASPRVTVLGATGMIGDALNQELQRQGSLTTVLVRPSSRNFRKVSKNSKVVVGSLEAKTIAKAMEESEVIYHAAGTGEPLEANQNPVQTLLEALNTLRVADAAGEKRIIFLSTELVYSTGGYTGGPSRKPAKETAELPAFKKDQPAGIWLENAMAKFEKYVEENREATAEQDLNFIQEFLRSNKIPPGMNGQIYGLTKILQERFVRLAPNGLNVRLSQVYGPADWSRARLTKLIRLFALNEPLGYPVWRNQKRRYIHVSDVARILVALGKMENLPRDRTLNLGSPELTGSEDILKILKEAHPTVRRHYKIADPSKKQDPISSQDRLQSLLPKIGLEDYQWKSLESGIPETVAWYEAENTKRVSREVRFDQVAGLVSAQERAALIEEYKNGTVMSDSVVKRPGHPPLDLLPVGNSSGQPTLLITGIGSMMGSNLARLILKRYPQARVLGVDNFSLEGSETAVIDLLGGPDSSRITIYRGDILEKAFMQELVEESDGVFHIAAESNVDLSYVEGDKFKNTNIEGTRTVVEAVMEENKHRRQVGKPKVRLLHVSTDEVYGDTPPQGSTYFDEDAPYGPTNPYAETKVEGEKIVLEAGKTNPDLLPYIVARPSNAWIPFKGPINLMPNTVVWRRILGMPIPLFGNPDRERYWIHGDNLVDGLVEMMLRSRPNEVYNIVGQPKSLIDVVLALLTKMEGRPITRQIAIEEGMIEILGENRGHNDKAYPANDSKYRRTFGVDDARGFNEGIDTLQEWYSSHTGLLLNYLVGDKFRTYYRRLYHNYPEKAAQMEERIHELVEIHWGRGARLALSVEAQKQIEDAAKQFQLQDASKLYLTQMWLQYLNQKKGVAGDKQPLRITLDRNKRVEGENFILASTLTDLEREKLLGAYPYDSLTKDPENTKAAKNVVLTLNPLDGGIGESLKRAEYLKKKNSGLTVELGAKGTDLGFDPVIGGKKVFVSIAEAKILGLLKNAQSKPYAEIKYQPLVNKASKGSYTKLLRSKSLVDKDKSYWEVMNDNGIEISEMLMQDDLPGIEESSGDLMVGAGAPSQPGGHGQWGYYFLANAFKIEPARDGRSHIRMFLNGDNLNEKPDQNIVGFMDRNGYPIIKLTTPATDIDKKGGKDGLRVVRDAKGVEIMVPDQMEEADAKAADKKAPGQLDTFYAAGLKNGFGEAGKQPFNTNMFYINDTVLHDIVAELVGVIGEDEYYRVISPTYISKASKKNVPDGRMYFPIDGAIGTAMHNLNSYFLTSKDPKVMEILTKRGLDRLLYFVDVPRSFFTPVKKTYDIYFQAKSNFYSLDVNQWQLNQNNPNLAPPDFDLPDGDPYWTEYQNLIDALGELDVTQGLKELRLRGQVFLRDAIVIGRVHIENRSGALVDLNSEKYNGDLPRTESNRLRLENVQIVIDATGKMHVTTNDSFLKAYKSDQQQISSYFDGIHQEVVNKAGISQDLQDVAKETIKLYYERAYFYGVTEDAQIEFNAEFLGNDSELKKQSVLFPKLRLRSASERDVLRQILNYLGRTESDLQGILAYFAAASNLWNHHLAKSEPGRYHYLDLSQSHKPNASKLYWQIQELLERQRAAGVTFTRENWLKGLVRRRLGDTSTIAKPDALSARMIRIIHNDVGASVQHPHQQAFFLPLEFIPESRVGIERFMDDHPERVLWHEKSEGLSVGELVGWPSAVGLVEGSDSEKVADKVYSITQTILKKGFRFDVLLSTTSEANPRFLIYVRKADESSLRPNGKVFGNMWATFEMSGGLIIGDKGRYNSPQEKLEKITVGDVLQAYSETTVGDSEFREILGFSKNSPQFSPIASETIGKYFDLFYVPSRSDSSRLNGAKGSKPGDFLAYYHWPGAEKGLRISDQSTIVSNVIPFAPDGLVIFGDDTGLQVLTQPAVLEMLVIWKEIKDSLDARLAEGKKQETITAQVPEADLEHKIAFGTSGWRAGTDKGFTVSNVGRFAQAAAEHLKAVGYSQRIAVGFDARPNAQAYAKHIVEVLAANGFKADLIDQVNPTPILAEATRQGADYGIAFPITASHNPLYTAIDSGHFQMGIKMMQGGVPAGDDITGAISGLANDPSRNASYKWTPYEDIPGDLSRRGVDLIVKSEERLRKVFDFNELSKAPFKVVLDSMFGGTVQAAKVLEKLGIVKKHLRDVPMQKAIDEKIISYELTDPDGNQVPWRPEPLEFLLKHHLLAETGPDELGAAFDGDGDRAWIKDLSGRILSPNELGLIFAHYLHSQGERGVVVRTLPSTHHLDRFARSKGLLLEETPVGSKYFGPFLDRLLIGVEESGHIFFRYKGEVFADSAIAEVFLAVEILQKTGKSLSEYLDGIHREIGELHYVRTALDVSLVTDELKTKLAGRRADDKEFPMALAQNLAKTLGKTLAKNPVDLRDKSGVKVLFDDDSWTMYRISGTDGSIRIYAEDTTPDGLKQMTQTVQDTIVAMTEDDAVPDTRLPSVDPTKTGAWTRLEQLYEKGTLSLRDLFKDNKRAERYTEFFKSESAAIDVDYSKNLFDADVLEGLFALARETGLEESIELMFKGAEINETENRAVLHTALRVPSGSVIEVDGKNVVPDVHRVLQKMKTFSDRVRSGVWKGYTGRSIKDVVNIGIGGSDLGPVMASEALKPYADRVRTHFVSNVDGTHITEVLKGLDPETTLVVVASKTFTTQETMTNAETARKWFLKKARDEKHIKKHFVAVSTNKKEVEKFGIDPENMFEFWDWVGGRYSLWSAIGLSVMISVGYDNFNQMLAGAHDMDEHFRNMPLEKNIPTILGLLSIWYRNFHGAQTHAILPYDQYMHRFPAYLQQAFMESNGKGTDRQGNAIDYEGSSVIFGEAGTNGQHSFYQLFHQGTQIVPADFIGVVNSQSPVGDHHAKLLSNFLGQTRALAFGKTREEVLQDGVKPEQVPHRVFTGNNPTTSILVKELTPRALGALTALYEHQIFVEGVVLNVFSYDQWGVELGKKEANELLPFLQDAQTPLPANLDPSTLRLLERIREQHKNAPSILAQSVDRLNLNSRARAALKEYNIITIGQLTQLTPAEVLWAPDVGWLTLRQIEDALRKHGLYLAGQNPNAQTANLDPSTILNENIELLNLNNRALYGLMNLGVKTVGQLTRLTSEEIFQIPNLGRKTLRHIEDALKEHGLYLADRNPNLADDSSTRGARLAENIAGSRLAPQTRLATLREARGPAGVTAPSEKRDQAPVLDDPEILGFLAKVLKAHGLESEISKNEARISLLLDKMAPSLFTLSLTPDLEKLIVQVGGRTVKIDYSKAARNDGTLKEAAVSVRDFITMLKQLDLAEQTALGDMTQMTTPVIEEYDFAVFGDEKDSAYLDYFLFQAYSAGMRAQGEKTYYRFSGEELEVINERIQAVAANYPKIRERLSMIMNRTAPKDAPVVHIKPLGSGFEQMQNHYVIYVRVPQRKLGEFMAYPVELAAAAGRMELFKENSTVNSQFREAYRVRLGKDVDSAKLKQALLGQADLKTYQEIALGPIVKLINDFVQGARLAMKAIGSAA